MIRALIMTKLPQSCLLNGILPNTYYMYMDTLYMQRVVMLQYSRTPIEIPLGHFAYLIAMSTQRFLRARNDVTLLRGAMSSPA